MLLTSLSKNPKLNKSIIKGMKTPLSGSSYWLAKTAKNLRAGKVKKVNVDKFIERIYEWSILHRDRQP